MKKDVEIYDAAGVQARREGPVAEAQSTTTAPIAAARSARFSCEKAMSAMCATSACSCSNSTSTRSSGSTRHRRRHARQGTGEPRSRGGASGIRRKPRHESDDPPGATRACRPTCRKRISRRRSSRPSARRLWGGWVKLRNGWTLDPARHAGRRPAADHRQRPKLGEDE